MITPLCRQVVGHQVRCDIKAHVHNLERHRPLLGVNGEPQGPIESGIIAKLRLAEIKLEFLEGYHDIENELAETALGFRSVSELLQAGLPCQRLTDGIGPVAEACWVPYCLESLWVENILLT